MGEIWERSKTSSTKRCPRCQKHTLTQSEYTIKCANCGYGINLPQT